MRKLVVACIAAFSVLLSACATPALLPESFDTIYRTSVLLEDAHGHGTGTIIAGNLVLTAAHVAEQEALKVTLHDGAQREAKLAWKSATVDVAVLRFDGAPIKETAVIDCRRVERGEWMQWVGNPSILRKNYNTGFVSSPDLVIANKGEMTGMIPLSANINPGDSGSGMFDDFGHVRGVAVAFLTTNIPQGFGFAPSQSGIGLMVPASQFCADMMSHI
jgi:serine protease Do